MSNTRKHLTPLAVSNATAPYTKPKENVFIIPSTFAELSRFINEE